MIRRALSLALVLALVAVPTVALARKAHPHAALGTQAVTVSPDPIVVGEPFTVTVTTDTYGWLREESPCLVGWVNLAPGESTVSLAAPCAGTVSLELTDTAGGRSVSVRITDWCQCYKGELRERAIDLSPSAFERLAPLAAGLVWVRIDGAGRAIVPPATDR